MTNGSSHSGAGARPTLTSARSRSASPALRTRLAMSANSFAISKRLDSKPTDVWKIVGGIVGILAAVGAFLYQGKAYIDGDLNRHEGEISRIIETAVSKDDFRRSQDGQDSWLANLRDRARADEEIINTDPDRAGTLGGRNHRAAWDISGTTPRSWRVSIR